MERLSPIVQVVQNDHCQIRPGSTGFISLATKPRMPKVQKLRWEKDKRSMEWLKRIRQVNSTLALDSQPEIVLDQELFHNPKLTNETLRTESRSDTTDGIFHSEPFLYDPEIADNSQGRKPDSAYISQISKSICMSANPKGNCDDFDGNLTSVMGYSSKYDQVPEKNSSPPGGFLESKDNQKAKRKTSFEYIQGVSMLQYGHNSEEFRR